MSGNQLKILHVIPAIAPRYGGPSQLVIEMCQTLMDVGQDVAMVTTDADGDHELKVERHQWQTYQGVRTFFFRRSCGEGFKFARGMARWFRNHVDEFDLVHIHAVFSWSSLAVSRACREKNIPYLVRPLGSLDPWSMSQKPIRKKVLWRLGIAKMLGEAKAIHYTSALEKQYAESSLGLTNGVVIANGISLNKYAAPLGDSFFNSAFPDLKQKEYLLFLGRLHPKKKLLDLIKGFYSYCHQQTCSPSMQLVIAGDGDERYRGTLWKFVCETGLENRVIFIDWIQGKEKIALLQNSALKILISDNENYGISVVESMAAGRPVVVNQGVYLYPHIENTDAGWVVPSSDNLPDALANTLTMALSNLVQLDRKGERACNAVATSFSWDAIGPRLVDVYDKILKRGL